MPLKRRPKVRSLALTALRRGRGMTEQELANELSVSLWMVNYYETEAEPSYEKLVEWGKALEYSLEEVKWLVFGLGQALRPAPVGGTSPVDPTPSEMRLIREIAGRAGRAAVALIARAWGKAARTWRVLTARREAGRLWRELERTLPELRRAAVETFSRFQTWAVAERLANESAIAASDQAARALELAELGYRVAELAGGDEAFLSGVKGYTLVLVANARRVANQMHRAGEDSDRALVEWGRASSEIKKILPGWRVKDLGGSLRRDQRRFPEALESLQEAQLLAPANEVPRILVKRAVTLEHMFEPEQAVKVLEEAAALNGGKHDAGLAWDIGFNLAVNLGHLEKFREAAATLPRLRELAFARRKELHLVRVAWLTARCDAGLGRTIEARAGFEQVRHYFATREMAADYALASLERAVLDLEAGRHGEVRSLAEEMKWIFLSQGLEPEAHAALALFREAAAQERATADLARRLVRYLYRAQFDPRLRFEAEETGRQGLAGPESGATD